jgi:hypothetical protein
MSGRSVRKTYPRQPKRGAGRGAPSICITVIAIVLLACSIQLASAAPPPDAPTDAFSSNQIAEKLLTQIRDGLQSYNSRKMLSAFDREGMQAYPAFQDQVEAFYAQYESFRVAIKLEEISFEQDKGAATASFRLEGIPRFGGPAIRREGELIFEFSRTRSGWKIRDVSPRNFFS